MKTDEAFNPFDVDLFRSGAIAVCAEGGPDPVEQFGRVSSVSGYRFG
jgi:hypothetical protein